MPLLSDVRHIFRRRSRPVKIDVTGTQAETLGGAVEAPGSGGGDLRQIEPKPLGARRADAARTQEEVMSLVRRIGEHLDTQSERTERLLGLMGRLPQALDSLPEINRQNARLLESLHEHFSQARRREEALNETLGTMSESSSRQTEVLGLVQQHIETNGRNAETLTDTLSTLQQALGDLAESNRRSSDLLQTVSEAAHERESELLTTLKRTNRWMIGTVCFCGIVSVGALGLALAALLA